jgi:hypothetical protein
VLDEDRLDELLRHATKLEDTNPRMAMHVRWAVKRVKDDRASKVRETRRKPGVVNA